MKKLSISKVLGSIILPILFFLFWSWCGNTGRLNTNLIPTPEILWQTFLDMVEKGTLQKNIAISFSRVLKGYAIGLLAGLFAGVCLGAALTVLLSMYEYYMVTHPWAELAAEIGIRTDVSRFGAQVINGIGFLGAGTIIVTGRQEVKGMTTAAGLWASACTGLAIGAGFYECVFLAFLLISIVIRVLPQVETYIVENARNMNIYVEFESLDDVGDIISRIKSQDVQIYDVEIDHGREEKLRNPSAVFSIRLNHKQMHTQVLAAISELESVRTIDEI